MHKYKNRKAETKNIKLNLTERTHVIVIICLFVGSLTGWLVGWLVSFILVGLTDDSDNITYVTLTHCLFAMIE